MSGIAVLIIGVLYAGYAGVVYWRLRTSSTLQAEIVATRSRVRCTPPFHLFASLLVPAMPLIAELASIINGLLWPVEMITAVAMPEGWVMAAPKPGVAPVPEGDRIACLDALAAEVSSADAYLRHRPNLKVETGCLVARPQATAGPLVLVAVPTALVGSAVEEATRTVAGEDSWPG